MWTSPAHGRCECGKAVLQGTAAPPRPAPTTGIDEVMVADAAVRPCGARQVPGRRVRTDVPGVIRPDPKIPEIAGTCMAARMPCGGCLAKCPAAILSRLDEAPSGAVRFP